MKHSSFSLLYYFSCLKTCNSFTECRPVAGKGLQLQVFEMDVEDVVDSGNQVENFVDWNFHLN